MGMQPMSQNEIQDFLRKLQNDIEEGKNLLSQSVSSSVDLHNLKKDNPILPREPDDDFDFNPNEMTVDFSEIPNPFALQEMEPLPQKPEYEQTILPPKVKKDLSQETERLKLSRTLRLFDSWRKLALKLKEEAQIERQKQQERQLLISFKLERILYLGTLKDGFENLREHRILMIKKEKEAKLDQLRNFRALKFWSKKMKRRVFRNGFVGYMQRCLRKRQNALKVYVFIDSTVNSNLQVAVLAHWKLYMQLSKLKTQKLERAQLHHRRTMLKTAFVGIQSAKAIRMQKEALVH